MGGGQSFPRIDPMLMTAEDVANYLIGTNPKLEKYKDAIEENNICGKIILEINDSDFDDCLAEINVTNVLHQKAFRVAFKELIAIAGQTSSSLVPSPSSQALSSSDTAAPSQVQNTTAASSPQKSKKGKYDYFATHTWLDDGLGRNTHERVIAVHRGLTRRGLSGWIDDEKMEGNIPDQMCAGIDDSTVVVVFVTEKYITKVRGLGPRGDADNCKLEFQYASSQKTAKRMIAVVMEPACRASDRWQGAVGMTLGSHLYVDMSGEIAEQAVDGLYDAIVKCIQKIDQSDALSVVSSGVASATGGGEGGAMSTADREIAEARAKLEREIAEASALRAKLDREIAEASAMRAEAEREIAEARAEAERVIAEARAKAEKEAAERAPRSGSLTIPSHGGKYVGMIVNGEANGFGVCTWDSGERKGNRYEGTFANNIRNGRGKVTCPDGRVYDGEWLDDKLNGRGKYTWPDGQVYDGEWLDGKRTGRGKLTYPNGEVYDGEWLDDKYNGRGKYTWPSGAVYDGEYKDDQKNGRGKHSYSNGDVYEGEWQGGKRNGRGKLTSSNGDVYDGQWKNDAKSP